MKTTTHTLRDATQIKVYDWLVQTPKAHLLIVHGYAEHARRYDHFARFLNEQNISVTSYDQRGYGASDGLRAYVKRFHVYVDDLEEIVGHLPATTPKILMGHSMGGQVALQYVLGKGNEPFKALISSSAMLEIDKDLSPILQALAPILGFLFPKLKTEKLDKTYITRSPDAKEAYMNDPLIYHEGTRARTGAEFLKTIKSGKAGFSKVDLPLLVMHGTADRLTMPSGSEQLHSEASSQDKTLKLFDGLYHELINEPEQEEVMEFISSWIAERS